MQTHNTGSLCCELKWGGKKRGFLGKNRSLLVEYDYQLPLFCFPDLVQSNSCTFPLVCWVTLLLLLLFVCGQTHKWKRGGGSCVPCLGSLCTALGRLWRMQVGKQTQQSPGRQICVWESFPRQRNLCGFLSVCSINWHSSHWKGC